MKLSVKEIESKLQENSHIDQEFLQIVKSDERRGVQKVFAKWEALQKKQAQLIDTFEEMLHYERMKKEQGFALIAGVDEVGRGPLAGPVVASAVILPDNFQLLGLNDSKKVTKKNREAFFEIINREAVSIGIGIVSAADIDRINIYQASKLAMQKAIASLKITPDYLLIDAMQLSLPIPQMAIIKGDSKSISIAASSIIAKVTRDQYMEKLADKFPNYGFGKHMGYGTVEHLAAIDHYGICHEHRRSFAPIRNRCQEKA